MIPKPAESGRGIPPNAASDARREAGIMAEGIRGAGRAWLLLHSRVFSTLEHRHMTRMWELGGRRTSIVAFLLVTLALCACTGIDLPGASEFVGKDGVADAVVLGDAVGDTPEDSAGDAAATGPDGAVPPDSLDAAAVDLARTEVPGQDDAADPDTEVDAPRAGGDANPDVADAAADVANSALDAPDGGSEVLDADVDTPDGGSEVLDADVDAPDGGSEVLDAAQDASDAVEGGDVAPVCPPGKCNDGNLCTSDACAATTGACSHAPTDGLACDIDGSGCTQGDACKAGACAAGPLKVCPAVKDLCLKAICLSESATQATCGTEPDKAGGTCDDASACTTGDLCDGKGACTGKAVDCSGTACQTATCDPSDGSCSKKKKPEGSPCDDGDVCTVVDSCSNGACKGGLDACIEERIDLKAGATAGVTVASLGFGRFATHWVGSGAGENSLRITDHDGSREEYETGSPVTDAGSQAFPSDVRSGRTFVVDSGGKAVLASFGTSKSQQSSKSCAGNDFTFTANFGPILVHAVEATGGVGPAKAVLGLKGDNWVWNSWGCYYILTQTLGWARWSLLPFPDGSIGVVGAWKQSFGTANTITGEPLGGTASTPAAFVASYALATPQLVAGPPATVAGTAFAYRFDARVLPDATDRFVLAWTDGDGGTLVSQLFSKKGQPLGQKLEVHVGTPEVMGYPRLAAFADGGYVVVWELKGGTAPNVIALMLRRVDDKGQFAGPAVALNQAANNASVGEIEVLADGGFVVAWHESQGDGLGDGAKFRRFLANGNPSGSEAALHLPTAGNQMRPSVSALDDGGFVAAYLDGAGQVFTRRFDKNAKPVPGAVERPLAQDPAGAQTSPRVATLGGTVLTAWQTVATGQDPDVRIRLLDAKGSTLLAETSVTTATPVHASAPAVAAGATRFTVAWIAGTAAGQEIRLRSFDAKGEPLGPDTVATASGTQQTQPAVAVGADGGALVAWTVGGGDIEAQRFDVKGKAVGPPHHLPADETGKHSEPVLVAVPDGFIAGWRGPGSAGDMVVLQRLDSAGLPTGKETPPASTGGKKQGLALAAQGSQVLACWQGWEADGPSNWGIVCRFVTAANLAPIGPEFSPHLASALDQTAPGVAFVGEVAVVAWTTPGLDGAGQGLQAAWLGAAGKLLVPRVTVNRTRAGHQIAPAVAALPGGKAAFVWQSSGQEAADDLGGVHLRVLTGP